jgi:hypothetical protein
VAEGLLGKDHRIPVACRPPAVVHGLDVSRGEPARHQHGRILTGRRHRAPHPDQRVVESFLYADAIAGEQPDLENAVDILKLMLR